MYKTIRHGENSLQYTILPQNDDFRIEGKLSGAGRSASSASTSTSGSGSGSPGNPSAKVKGHRRRRSFFAYLGLIFVCTVIVGAVLIPFLVSAECLPNPTEWFLRTKAALIQHGSGTASTSGSASGLDLRSGPGAAEASSASPLLQENVGRNVQIVNRNGVEQFVIKLNKTSTTAEVPPSTPSSTTTSSTSTTTTTTTTPAPRTTAAPSTTLPTTTTTREPPPRHLMPTNTTNITTRIIQVPLLKSAAKKPIMPPVLAKAQGNQVLQPPEGAKVPAEEQAGNRSNSAWIKTHWAYIDPSTYFQWTGYKAEDSVLLPALLGFALIAVILIITVCLVARNKRTIVSSVRKRNRN
ncbi:hypothetical protein KR018_008224, partial [Drosophila ironensis]